MASNRALIASILIFLLAFHLVDSESSIETNGELKQAMSQGSSGSNLLGKPALDCGGACEVRCARSSRPNLCKRACRTCCARCQCVPPGTYGNYEFCPCYAAITTRGGRPKCP